MGSDINKRSPALLLFVQEYSPGRNSPAADRKRLTQIDVAKLAIFTELLKVLAVTAEAVLVSN
ncbi:hypothetical protein D3C80_1535910 [compost metagenome]